MTVGLGVALRTGPDWKTELYYRVKDKTTQSSDNEGDTGQNQEEMTTTDK